MRLLLHPGGDGNSTGEEGARASEGSTCVSPGQARGCRPLFVEATVVGMWSHMPSSLKSALSVQSHTLTMDFTFPVRFHAESR